MIEEGKNIDQIFRDAANAQSAPAFQEIYWEEMSALMHQEKKRKYILYISMIIGSITSVLLSLLLFTYPTENTVLYSQNKEDRALEVDLIPISKQENISFVSKGDNLNKEIDLTISSNSSASTTPLISTYSVINSNSINTLEYEKNTNENTGKIINNNLNLSIEDGVYTDKNEERNTENHLLTIKKVNSIPLSQNESSIISNIEKFPSVRRVHLFAKLDLGVMENYKTSRPYESGIFNFSIQLEGNINNLTIRTGAGLQYTSHAELIMSKVDVIPTNFGNSTRLIDLTYQDLYDVYVPIEFGYKFNKINFGIGIQANYLFNTRMNFYEYTDNILTQQEHYNGKAEGLKRFSTQGYLWIERPLFSHLAIGGKIGTNISGRISEIDYFNQSSTTNPIYGQLFLRFNFFK